MKYFNQIKEILEQEFHINDVLLRSRFIEDMGFTDLKLTSFFSFLEEYFGVFFGDDWLEIRTVHDLDYYLSEVTINQKLLEKLSEFDMHVHVIDPDIKYDYPYALLCLCTHYIMKGDKIIHFGTVKTIEIFVMNWCED